MCSQPSGATWVRRSFGIDRAQFIDGAPEIDSVPEDDGGDGEVEAGGAVALIFEGAVADFAETVEEHGPREGMVRLALVEAGVRASPQGGVADPVEREQCALQAADFLERFGERVLSRIGGQAAQDRRGRDGSRP
jgi:hypothetical protein